jgi:hypothetical protein
MRDINCFWFSGTLGDIEQICLLSMLKQGHRVRLFSYKPLQNVPSGIELADAREILPIDEFIFHRQTGSPSLGSNKIRYIIMNKGLGVWLDADIILLKPLDQDSEYIFGWEDQYQINNAVLHFPPKSDIANDIVNFVSKRYPIPPFYDTNTRHTLLKRLLITGDPVDVQDLPWGVYGPQALTYFVKKHQLLPNVSKQGVFYPVHHSSAHALLSSKYDVTPLITTSTISVHLWNAKLRQPSRIRPNNPPGKIIIERGSFVHKFAREQLGFKIKDLK